jgi:hypothetical protein
MGKNTKRRREVRDATRIRGVDGSPKGLNRSNRRYINQALRQAAARASVKPTTVGKPEPSPEIGPKHVGTIKDDRALADKLGFKRRPSGLYAPGGRGSR